MSKKLRMSTMFGYGLAALGFNFVFNAVSSYVNIFFTNVLGISIAATGFIMLIARLWDGINDPIMGAIVDKTNTRFGKYRPYLIIGMIPLVIFSILIFQAPNLSIGAKTIYAAVVYIGFGMSYTLANIPYMSMLTTLTDEPDKRTVIVTIKNIFVLLGVMIPTILVPAIAIKDEGYIPSGFALVGVIGAIILIITMSITFISTRNNKYISKTQKFEKITFKERLNAVINNKPLLMLVGVILVFSLQGVFMGAQTYFVVDGLNQGGKAMLFSIVALPMMLLSMISMPIAVKFEKKNVVQFGMVLYAIGAFAFQLVPNENITLLLVTTAIKGLGMGYLAIMVWSMVADAADYSRSQSGRQQSGIIFSTTTFVQKATMGIGALILNGVLIAINFVPNSIGEQSELTVMGLKSMNGIIPGILAISVIFILRKYPLSKEKMQEIKTINDELEG